MYSVCLVTLTVYTIRILYNTVSYVKLRFLRYVIFDFTQILILFTTDQIFPQQTEKLMIMKKNSKLIMKAYL